MAFKMTKEHLAARSKAVEELNEAAEAVKEAITAYNAAVGAAREFVEELASDMRSEFDDKSERWQEGDKGQEVDGWISELENATLDDLEEPAFDHVETLEGLPEAP